jgi:hypothetical protein
MPIVVADLSFVIVLTAALLIPAALIVLALAGFRGPTTRPRAGSGAACELETPQEAPTAATDTAINTPTEPKADSMEEHAMASGTFGTAINCMDGRAQSPVADWVKMNGSVTYVDMVTIPGPDKALTQDTTGRVAHIREYVGISVNAHHSGIVAVAGHYDCAAYPASQDEHIASIRQAAKVVESWGYGVRVVGLWVNEWFQVEKVYDSADAA